MGKPFSLQPVRDLVQRESDSAARTLATLNEQEAQARATLRMLLDCRGEYAKKLAHTLEQGISPSGLYNYREFLAKLEQAIGQQREIVRQAQARTEKGRQAWQTQLRRLKSFDVLAEREMMRERRLESRREQKQLDEFTTVRTPRSG